MPDANYFHMPLFRPGIVVQWGSKRETVSHILVRRSSMLVHMVGVDVSVASENLTLALTLFSLLRVA